MGIINYKRTGDIVEITVRDCTGAKMAHWVCEISNKKKYSSILKYLKDAFGFEPEIDIDESINKQEENRDDKIDWWG